jgi:hypothetical protein
VPLERLSPYLSAHMKNIQNGGRMESVHQFEYEVLLDSELDLLKLRLSSMVLSLIPKNN